MSARIETAGTSMPYSPIAELVARARAAQRIYETWSQEQVVTAVVADGWAIIEPNRNRELAELAVVDTGVGNVEDKVGKNYRKIFGLLRDLRGATPANKIINALKGRNAVIVAPSPKGWSTCARLIEFIHAQFDRIDAPRDLVQLLPPPVNKQSTAELMRLCDLVVATGSQANVRAAYASGTPAFGVGASNVAGILDEMADVALAADRIVRSKTFDNATSCSSENSLVIVAAARAAMLDRTQKATLQSLMWPEGKAWPHIHPTQRFAKETCMTFLRQCLHETRLRTGDPLIDSPMAAPQITAQRVTDHSQRSLRPAPRSPLAVNPVRTAAKRRSESAPT